MLYPDRALEFAGAARRALKDRLLGNVHAHQRSFVSGTVLIQIMTHSQNDFLGVEDLAGVGRRAMLGTASAFDARKSLQRVQLRDILPCIEAEIFITGELGYV